MAEQTERNGGDPDLPGDEAKPFEESVEQAKTRILERWGDQFVKQLVERYGLEPQAAASRVRKLIEFYAECFRDAPLAELVTCLAFLSRMRDEEMGLFRKSTDSNDVRGELFFVSEDRRLAWKNALEGSRFQAAVRRGAGTFGQDLSINANEAISCPLRFPFNQVDKALEWVPKGLAFEYIKREDFQLVFDRLFAFEYLRQDNVPFYTLPQLEQYLTAFIGDLESERDNLIKTGLPQKWFGECVWLYNQLGRLYTAKATARSFQRDRTNSREDTAPEQSVKYVPRKGSLGNESRFPERCIYEEADLLNGLDREDAERLEANRANFFDLKIKVLQECRKAVHARDSSSAPWRACLNMITAAVNADDGDFLLRMDRFYIGREAGSDESSDASPKMIPGGLTNLLEVIGHCEKEITIGTLARTREGMGPATFDAVMDQFIALIEREADFWAKFKRRVNTAFRSEFFVDVAVHTRVRRPLVEKFEPHMQRYADLANASLELYGRLPEERGQQDPDPSAFRPASQLWPSRFPTYKLFQTYLKQHPEIRTRHPSRQRLEVHSGDFLRAVATEDKQSFDALAAPPEQIEAFLDEADRRKKAIPKKPGGRRPPRDLDPGK